MAHDFQDDIDAVGRIDAVSTILDVVCRTTGMGFAAVARVTDSRWIVCRVLDQINFGLQPGGELEVATTICDEIRQSGHAVVIDHVAQSTTFRDHHTPAQYGFQSYISMPIIRKDGSFFGTLCAIDPKPAKLENPETIGMFKLFAELIAAHLDADERYLLSQQSLSSEREVAELREQFIAILGHDLRNPVAAISAGTNMLLRTPLDDKARNIVNLMQGTVLRMDGLITNLLDFARGRLGDGLTIEQGPPGALTPALDQVIAELRSVNPNRVVDADIRLDQPIKADPARIAQMLSNLLGNAFSHGDLDAPISVVGQIAGEALELSVTNAGDPIPAADLPKIFLPFSRGNNGQSRQGLGLGLYIASEIARAHGGTLTASSDATETRFTFRMPVA